MAARPASPASGRWSWLFGGWSPKAKPKKAPTRDAPGGDEDDEEFYTFDAYHEARASPQTLRKRSEVLVRESEHRDRAVGLAIAREHRRLGAGGRLYTVVFKGDTLGFSLVLARLPESPRSRLVVDSTTLGGACYDLVRPLDELVAINNEKLIPIEMEAFPTLVYRLQHGPRPTRLTFSMGYGRDAAFREQSRRRSSRLPPGLPVSPGHQPRAGAFDSPEKVPPPPATPPPPPPPPRSFASAGIQTSSAAGAAASTCPQESGAILGDGLCQWDIDRAGDGEVLSAAEEV
ncbi:PGAP1-like protein [Aureococcus anophagefferens]|nr:PGAP1-like protein [Aureococcus anophagefferens]